MITYTERSDASPPYNDAVYILPTSVPSNTDGRVLTLYKSLAAFIDNFSTSLSPKVS